MPTVLIVRGYRFFFWSNENDEPMHVHVEKGGSEGKIWLMPRIRVAYIHGFTMKEQKVIIDIVAQNILTLKQKWDEYFTQ